jgi:hypothetical protein
MEFSSDPALGAINILNNGSYFEMPLNPPLTLPKTATHVRVGINTAEVWYTQPNILTGVNDKMYIRGPDTVDVLQDYVVTLQEGLYGINELNTAIIAELEVLGAKITPFPLIELLENSATNHLLLRLNYTTVEVDFLTNSDTPRIIMGFDARVVGPDAGAPINEQSDNVAAFNSLNNYFIKSDIVGDGMRFNNGYSGILAKIPITATPNSLINYHPRNISWVDGDVLTGAKRTKLRFNITDQNGEVIDMNDEFWTLEVVIKYTDAG